MYHKRQKNIGWTPTQGQPPNRCLAAGLTVTRLMHSECGRICRGGGRWRGGGAYKIGTTVFKWGIYKVGITVDQGPISSLY